MNRQERMAMLERTALVVLGLYLAGSGIRALIRGVATYSNWLRWSVPAPVAMALGVFLIVVGLRLYRSE